MGSCCLCAGPVESVEQRGFPIQFGAGVRHQTRHVTGKENRQPPSHQQKHRNPLWTVLEMRVPRCTREGPVGLRGFFQGHRAAPPHNSQSGVHTRNLRSFTGQHRPSALNRKRKTKPGHGLSPISRQRGHHAATLTEAGKHRTESRSIPPRARERLPQPSEGHLPHAQLTSSLKWSDWLFPSKARSCPGSLLGT